MNLPNHRDPLPLRGFDVRSARIAALAVMLSAAQCAAPETVATQVPAPASVAAASQPATTGSPSPKRSPSDANNSENAEVRAEVWPLAAPTAAPSIAGPTPVAPAARMLGAVYHAETRDGWIDVTVPAKDIEGLRQLAHAIGGDGVLWRGDRRVPAEVRAFAPIYLLNAGPPTEARTYAVLRPVISMSSDDWWSLRFRRGKLAGPFLAVSEAPDPGVRLRRPPKPRRTKLSDPLVLHLRTGLDALDDPRAAEWYKVAVARRRVRHEIQRAPGVFPGATEVVAVSAFDAGDGSADPEVYGAVFTVDDTGAIVQRIDTNSGMPELRAVGDVDADGFDDIVMSLEGYEQMAHQLVRLTPGNVDVRDL